MELITIVFDTRLKQLVGAFDDRELAMKAVMSLVKDDLYTLIEMQNQKLLNLVYNMESDPLEIENVAFELKSLKHQMEMFETSNKPIICYENKFIGRYQLYTYEKNKILNTRLFVK